MYRDGLHPPKPKAARRVWQELDNPRPPLDLLKRTRSSMWVDFLCWGCAPGNG